MRNIFLHHSGGLGSDNVASTAHLTPDKINEAHRNRWDFRSVLGYFGGYNVIYDPKTRTFTQHRALGEETAAQKGYNNEFSLCIIGNYNKSPFGAPLESIDEMTQTTKEDVAEFLYKLIHGNHNLAMVANCVPNFSITRIFPHRHVGNTECYGSFLSDDVFKAELIRQYAIKKHLPENLVKLYVSTFTSLSPRLDVKLGNVADRECFNIE